MSSTDNAFIRAYRDLAPTEPKPAAPTEQRTFTIGSNQYRMTEFVTDPTKVPVSTEIVTNATAPIDERQSADQPVVETAAVRTKSKSLDELELIELRIDPAPTNVVPAPHISVAAFAKKVDPQGHTRPVERQIAPAQEIQPIAVPSLHHVSPKATQFVRSDAPNAGDHAGMARPVLSAFTPAWEVDAFQWPPVCDQLDAMRSEPLSNFVRSILADAWQGTKVVAVTQFGRGEGGTTLSLCLAKWAAMFAGRVALVDGDIMRPRIADSLGLAFNQGWEECSVQLPLSEIAITSVADRLTVLPLGPKGALLAAKPDREHGEIVLQQLADAFELVIVDAGPMFDAAYQWFSPPTKTAIGSALVVQDVRQTSAEQVSDVRRRLITNGIERVSIVENFRSASSPQKY